MDLQIAYNLVLHDLRQHRQRLDYCIQILEIEAQRTRSSEVEHPAFNRGVLGSNPSGSTIGSHRDPGER